MDKILQKRDKVSNLGKKPIFDEVLESFMIATVRNFLPDASIKPNSNHHRILNIKATKNMNIY